MCEFCSFGPNSNKSDRDSTNPVFSGFFSADAIEAAVRQTTQKQQQNRRNRRAQIQENVDDNDQLRGNSGIPLECPGSADDDEEEEGEEDDDGT